MKLYRYTNNVYDSPRINVFYGVDLTCVYLHEYEVTKETPCGSWIVYKDKKKFVNHKHLKQFAYKSLSDAKSSFLLRKKRQIHILEFQLNGARYSIRAMEKEPMDFDKQHHSFLPDYG